MQFLNSNGAMLLAAGVQLAIACGLVGSSVSPVAAAELRVPQGFPTIQAAVDAAKSGDVVLVQAGTYRERVRLKERVTLRSAGTDAPGKLGLARAEATIIDGTGKPETSPGVAMAEGARRVSQDRRGDV